MSKWRAIRIPAHLIWLVVFAIVLAACGQETARPGPFEVSPKPSATSTSPDINGSAPIPSATLIRIITRPGGPTPTRVPTWMLGPYPLPRDTPVPRERWPYPEPLYTPEFPLFHVTEEPTWTPQPTLPAFTQPDCAPQGKYTRCRDDLLGISFEYPTSWGTIESDLRRGDTGYAYEYTFSEVGRAGGRSRDFTEGRGGILTDIFGFQGMNSWEYCDRFADLNIVCPVVKDNIVLQILFSSAQSVCDGIVSEPYAIITIDLPENKIVQGFGFVAPFISDEIDADLRTILEVLRNGELTRNCDPASQEAYDRRIADLSTQIRENRLDPETADNLKMLIHLAKSIQFK